MSDTTIALAERDAPLGARSPRTGSVGFRMSSVFWGLVTMPKYGVFVFLFVATVIIFFVGLFVNIFPMVLVGAVMLVALFFTRRLFIPTQERDA